MLLILGNCLLLPSLGLPTQGVELEIIQVKHLAQTLEEGKECIYVLGWPKGSFIFFSFFHKMSLVVLSCLLYQLKQFC